MPYGNCPDGYYWDEQALKCRLEKYDPSGGGYPDPLPPGGKQKPPGGAPTGGVKDPMDLPCPPGECKDVVSMVCRRFNPNREKVNMTDEWERESGGGRGYCRKLDGGGGGFGGGGGGAGGHGGGGGGAGGGFGGPGGDGGGLPDPSAAFNNLAGLGADVDAMIQSFAKGVLGGQTRYSPEVMQDILAGFKAESEGQVQQGTESLNQDLANRGLFRSPAGAAQAQQVRLAGDQRFSEGSRQLRVEKATKDFEDKLSAIDRAQADLNSTRSYIAQLDITQAEREKLNATIKLGYARIDAEMQMLLKQLASNKELLQLSLSSQEKLARMSIGSADWRFLMGLTYGQ